MKFNAFECLVKRLSKFIFTGRREARTRKINLLLQNNGAGGARAQRSTVEDDAGRKIKQ